MLMAVCTLAARLSPSVAAVLASLRTSAARANRALRLGEFRAPVTTLQSDGGASATAAAGRDGEASAECDAQTLSSFESYRPEMAFPTPA
mgnify:CR=1 FL=1